MIANAILNKIRAINSVNLNKLFIYYITHIDKVPNLCYDMGEHYHQKHAAIGCVLLRGIKKYAEALCKEKEKHYEICQVYVCHFGHPYDHYDSRERRCQNV